MSENSSAPGDSLRALSSPLAFATLLAESQSKSVLLDHELKLRNEEIAFLRVALDDLRKEANGLAEGYQGRMEDLEQRCDDTLLSLRAARHRLTELEHHRLDKPTGHSSPSVSRPVAPGARLLKVAAIVDEFTFDTFSPSCDMLRIPLSGWEKLLDEFSPDFIFVESAWKGNGGDWTGKVNHCSPDLMKLVRWCREHGVPTVFWNKEDPVHFDVFINTARIFGHVFTTDLECIGRYKAFLGHNNVHLLPFCGQIATHNPMESYERVHGFCFAGAYYARYPERTNDLETFVETLSTEAPFDIYDRNHGVADQNFEFPARYYSLIKGGLPHSEISRAYKGYDFGINLNSVKQSQSMFARRVFDLLLSNTHVVSNYSRGLRLMLGDLVTSTDDASTLKARLAPMLVDDGVISLRRYHRLLALRKAIVEHTAESRLSHIAMRLNLPYGAEREAASALVVAAVNDDQEVGRVLENFLRQDWSRKRLLLVLVPGYLPGTNTAAEVRAAGGEFLTKLDASAYLPSSESGSFHLAMMHPNDHYDTAYLQDLALGTLYANADAVGKATRLEVKDGALAIHEPGRQYTTVDTLEFRSALVGPSLLGGLNLWDLCCNRDRQLINGRLVALDEFSYVRDGVQSSALPELPIYDSGVPLDRLYRCSDEVGGAISVRGAGESVDAITLAAMFAGRGESGRVRLSLRREGLEITSALEPGEHKYLYAGRHVPVEDLCEDGELVFNLIAVPGLRLDVVFLLHDSDGKRLGAVIRPFGRNHREVLPSDTHSIVLGFRVAGPGIAQVAGLALHEIEHQSSVVQIGRARVLVVSNVYPSRSHLYRNGFVHRRVLGYMEKGIRCDVYCVNSRATPHSYEFDDVDVSVGGADRLNALLKSGSYETVLVHFLDPEMWDVLKRWMNKMAINVWLHGAEVQPWHRREFNYASEDERSEAMRLSEIRMNFWRDVMAIRHPNLNFVFVSHYFADEVMTDVGMSLDTSQYRIIHNFVDGNLFEYREKSQDQRYRLLSIRPFASKKYANDLTVQCILELQLRPDFDKLDIMIVGDGPMFDEVLEPLRELGNVQIERGFLTQEQIALLHRDYGVFLCPTRMDSQGVSRDEAMASGLVPVTNNVTAIPEFVDDSCGVLAPAEDWLAMADGINRIMDDPDLFLRMSKSAASRARELSGFSQTVEREIDFVRSFFAES